MNVGILYICTGKYDIFFEDFYKSCEEKFLTNHKKTYYVWTDSKKDVFNLDNVKVIYAEKLGWPNDTMLRFKKFNSIKETLLKEDILYFFNANMLIVSEITEDDMKIESNLVGVIHPYFLTSDNISFPYERNPVSTVSIPYGCGSNYFQGCLNGGKSKEFLKMSEILENLIDIDVNNGIIPIWHDESALNYYFAYNTVSALHPELAYPETSGLPYNKRIIQLDKNKLGGHNYLRS